MGTTEMGACPPWDTACLKALEMAPAARSALYDGTVKHRRTTPVVNEFRYSLFMVYLDLAELELVFANRLFWSVEGHTWASFRRADHLRREGPLDTAVRDLAEEQLGFRPPGPIGLLTHLRYLGYCFNPISIYYCFAADGQRLDAIVAEVHNTPWGEEYVRALDTRSAKREGEWYLFELEKEFHVSPFMPMDIRYTWRFTAPGETLAVEMENERQGEIVFSARLDLERHPLTGKNLARSLARWPWMTARVITAIYWQALRIRRKGVPFCPHPEKLTITKGAYHP
jgi:DUF1365 family protein